MALDGGRFILCALAAIAKLAIICIYFAAIVAMMSWLMKMHLCAHGDMAVCDYLLKAEAGR